MIQQFKLNKQQHQDHRKYISSNILNGGYPFCFINSSCMISNFDFLENANNVLNSYFVCTLCVDCDIIILLFLYLSHSAATHVKMIRLTVRRKNMQLPDRNGNIKSDYSCKKTVKLSLFIVCMPKISSGSRNCRHSSLSTHSAKPSFEINCLFFSSPDWTNEIITTER